MNTNKIETMGGAVNVTVHKNVLKNDGSTYAKVKRATADMGNVIAAVLKKTKVFDEASLVAASMLFKEAALELISQGTSVNLLELGTLYPSAPGGIRSANPTESEIPPLSLGFTPSKDALDAVAKAEVASASLSDTSPSIGTIEDLSTHRTDHSVTAGSPVRITGNRLKIAGNPGSTGLYLAPLSEEGSADETEADWIRAADESFFRNTDRYLELILPESLASGQRCALIIRTAASGGKLNKTVRELRYGTPLTVN